MRKLSKRQLQRIKHFFREKEERAKKQAPRFLHREPSGDARRKESIVGLMAEKVDQVVIIGSFVTPPLKTGLIDRLIVIAAVEGADPVIVLNKVDLLESRAGGEEIAGLYRSLG